MKKHETKTQIDYIDVADDGLSARVVTTNYERGMMPSQDSFGDETMIPVLGTSYCEQRLILAESEFIQMDGAECTTTINLEEAF